MSVPIIGDTTAQPIDPNAYQPSGVSGRVDAGVLTAATCARVAEIVPNVVIATIAIVAIRRIVAPSAKSTVRGILHVTWWDATAARFNGA
jgi:hypothetical protein